MRLALLGSDDELQALLRDLPAESGHTLVATYEADDGQLPLAAFLPNVERSNNWESLLVRDDIDLVLVSNPRTLRMGGDSLEPQGRRADQLKKLAQAGVNLLVSYPASDLLDGYEIEMLRREGGGAISIWFPGYYHPTWETFAKRLEERSAELDQISWSRAVTTANKANVLAALARDLILIEDAVGPSRRVTALSTSPAAANTADSLAWSRLTVQIETTAGAVIRWEVARPGSPDHLQIETRIDNRTIEFVSPADQAEAIGLLERLQAVAQPDTEWLKACRNLETISAVEKSLQRGRTIELSQAEQTEEHNFKGVMASGGCLLLLMILLTLFVVSLVEGLQLPLRNWGVWRLWPLGLIVPLAIFLAMQFLHTVIEKPANKRDDAPSSTDAR